MTVQSNKSLGAVGACLTITGVISTVVSIMQQVGGASTTNWIALAGTSVFSLLALVGSILFLVAMYGFSKDYSERRIFTNIIYGILIAIVAGVIIGVAGIGFAIISLIGQLPSAGSPNGSTQTQALIAPYTTILIPALSVVTLVTMFFIYRSYNLLAEKSCMPLFRTAGKVFVLSAILNIILGTVFATLAYINVIQYTTVVLALTPGAFVQYIAWALSAKGFFTIQPPAPPQPYPMASQTLYCPNCGAQTQAGNVYCVRCGKKL